MLLILQSVPGSARILLRLIMSVNVTRAASTISRLSQSHYFHRGKTFAPFGVVCLAAGVTRRDSSARSVCLPFATVASRSFFGCLAPIVASRSVFKLYQCVPFLIVFCALSLRHGSTVSNLSRCETSSFFFFFQQSEMFEYACVPLALQKRNL